MREIIINKTMRIGTIKTPGGGYTAINITVIIPHKQSILCIYGKTRGLGFGQINLYFNDTNSSSIKFSKNWNLELWKELLGIWKEYNLKEVNEIPLKVIKQIADLPL